MEYLNYMINPKFQDKNGRFIKNHKMEHTKEWNDNISKSLTGKIMSKKTKEILRKINTGKKLSEDTKRKIGDNSLKWWSSNENKKQQIEMARIASEKMMGNKNNIVEATGHGYGFLDITGLRFGKLVVSSLDGMQIRKNKTKKAKEKTWNVKCDCGNEIIVMERYLLNGVKTSCGCLPSKNAKNILGQKFSRLLVISYSGKKKNQCIWDVQCDCGVKKVVSSADLISGNTKSCGCIRSEIYKKNNALKRERDPDYNKGSNNPAWKGYKMIPGEYFNSVVKAASVRELEVDITIEFLAELYEKQNGLCALSGVPIDFIPQRIDKYGRSRRITASLDRIDSYLGYTKENVQWTNTDINMLKRQYGQEKFIEMCKLVANNNK